MSEKFANAICHRVALRYASHCCLDNASMGMLADTKFFMRCAKSWSCHANHATQSLSRMTMRRYTSIAHILCWILHAVETRITTRLPCRILSFAGWMTLVSGCYNYGIRTICRFRSTGTVIYLIHSLCWGSPTLRLS